MKIFASFLVLILGLTSPASAKWKVDSYGNIKDGRSSVIISNEDTYNCRMSITSTTFSFVGDDGNALSADNPCIVGIKDNGTGKNVAAAFTAPVSFTFGAGSDTDSNLFGLSGTNSWALPMPMFIGVVTDGTNNYFTLSRVPVKQTNSSVGLVCQKNDTSCGSEYSTMILASGLTLSNWTGKNVTQVGWIYGTWATTGSAWTFTITDGITSPRAGFNKNYEAITFAFPGGQNGSQTAGVYFYFVVATFPAWSSQTYTYTINRNGVFQGNFYLTGDGGTDGATATDVFLTMPYVQCVPGLSQTFFPVWLKTPTYDNYGVAYLGTAQRINFYRNITFMGKASPQFSEFTNGSREIQGSVSCQLITN